MESPSDLVFRLETQGLSISHHMAAPILRCLQSPTWASWTRREPGTQQSQGPLGSIVLQLHLHLAPGCSFTAQHSCPRAFALHLAAWKALKHPRGCLPHTSSLQTPVVPPQRLPPHPVSSLHVSSRGAAVLGFALSLPHNVSSRRTDGVSLGGLPPQAGGWHMVGAEQSCGGNEPETGHPPTAAQSGPSALIRTCNCTCPHLRALTCPASGPGVAMTAQGHTASAARSVETPPAHRPHARGCSGPGGG